MESFSNDNNSNKNLVEKKINYSLHPLKLCRVYLKLLNLSNVGNFSWT